MSGLLLHPTKGVNPFMTTCKICGKDADDIILVGANDRVDTCSSCGCANYGGFTNGKCGNCGNRGVGSRRELRYGEKLPVGLCKDCESRRKEAKEVVDGGGVLFKCGECGAEGAIRAGDFASTVRKALNVPTGPCGISFDKCEQHKGGE